MDKPTAILFICPNQDNFHGVGEYVAYLLIQGYELIDQKKGENWTSESSYYVRPAPDGFILRDEPSEGMQTGILGTFKGNIDILHYPHPCPRCMAKGVKS